MPQTDILGYPGDPKINENAPVQQYVQMGAQRMTKSAAMVAKSAPKCPQGLQNGAKIEVLDPPERTLNGDRAQNDPTCDPLVIYYV